MTSGVYRIKKIWNRKIVKKVVFAGITVSIFLLVLEMAMIVAEPYLFKGFYQYDPDLGFRVRSYANGTNRFGFNDRDYPLQRKPETFRILVLGDSFSWAGGVKNNYTALLEKKFEERYGGNRVEVINAGYPMTHTGEQFALLEKYGLQYQPDLVMVGFFAGNDFIDADPNRKRIVVNDTYFDIDRRFEMRVFGYPIVFKSRLWHFIRQKLIVWKSIDTVHAQDSGNDEKEDAGDGPGTFEENVYLEIEKYRLSFCHLPSYREGKYGKNIEYILRTFDRMKELLDQRGIGLFVAIYPDEFQVNNALLARVFHAFNLPKDQYDIELMQRILHSHFEKEGICYIDMLDSYRAKNREEPLYLKRNTHWNRSGNMLAAEILFQVLSPRINNILVNDE